MEKVIFYIRISTLKQDLERQRLDLNNYSVANNLEVVKIFEETISGVKSTDEREVLKECIDFAIDPKNNIKGVLVSEISRLGRKLKDVLINIDILTKKGIYVHSVFNNKRTLNPDGTPNIEGNLIISVMGSIADMERETLIYRVKSGLKEKLTKPNSATGGIVLYGYYTENKKMYINEEEANIVREVFDLYLNQNMGTTKIANYLNEKGVQTRNNLNKRKIRKYKSDEYNDSDSFQWSDSTIYNMLTKTNYVGFRIKKETNFTGEVINEIKVEQPQIIDTDVFNKVQKKLNSNFNKKDVNKKFNYIFKNELIRCGVCGLSYFAHHRTSGKDSAYKCITKRYNRTKLHNCSNVSVGISKLYSSVWYFLRRLDKLKDILETNKNNSDSQNEINELNNEQTIINNEIRKIEINEKKLVELVFSNPGFNQEMFKLKGDEFTKQKNKLIIELKNNKNKIIEIIDFSTKQYAVSEQIKLLKNNPNEMKKIVDVLVDKIIIYPVIAKKYKLGSVKNDTLICVHLYLYTDKNPIEFLISRFSDLIQPLGAGEFNAKTFEMCDPTQTIKERIVKIKHIIELKSI